MTLDSSDRKENVEQLSGNESPSGIALNEQESDEIRPHSDKDNPQRVEKKQRRKGGLSILIAVGLSLLLGMGYVYIKYDVSGLNKEKPELAPVRKILPIPKKETIKFDSFIIPFKENRRYTYISLSFVFSLPNKDVRDEMSRKRGRIRGILYNMFIEEVNRATRIPAIDHLKKSIIRTVNRVLSVGVVEEVFVTQFLAV